MSGPIFITAFLGVVARHGENIAVCESGEPTYSYNDLDRNAREIAAALVDLGLGPESVVGISIPKSADFIASLLGIWYAGAAFVPLDPQLPPERRYYMCQQAQVKATIEKLHPLQIRNMQDENDNSQAAAVSKKAPLLPLLNRPDDLAYIIFTSGSTGLPKGVMVEHRGIVNCLQAQIESFQLNSTSQSLWYLSSNFDASVSDIGTALLAGATMHIEPPESLQPGSGLTDLMASRGITYVDIPPSVLKLIPPETLPKTLQTIVIGGEACAPDVVRSVSARLRLINVYGPTEATICTSLGQCGKNWDKPLIGLPLPNTDYRLLDENLQAVPAGTAGQLYISGIGLARGYAGRPDLTAAKFIMLDGVRLYKTGDMIIQGQDGQYQFLGRSDRQFKLRGMLIEPEEIEARLMQHPLVHRAGVLKRPVKENGGRELLVAFVAGDGELDTGVLRQHLEQSLPRWMVPQRFEHLDEMPLTVTGKVDFSRLKTRPVKVQSTLETTAKTFDDPLHQTLAEIWTTVLGAESSNLEDDFFHLGGDSFAVVEVVVAAQARGLSFSPSLLLKNPTIGSLARAIRDREHCESLTGNYLRSDIASLISNKLITDTPNSELINKAATQPKNVLLTGATGFLGARLLDQLGRRTEAKIYCLVRAENRSDAEARILRALAAQKLDSEGYRDRIVAICGDLTATDFGLKKEEWLDLAEKIDTVFHSAAQVNMLLSYQDLRPANVEGTAQIVRFMQSGFFPKTLHYASTLSVFVATDQNSGRLLESDHLQNTSLIYGGYAQSKWASEVLLRQYAESLGPVTYHRLGLITGDCKNAISSTHDFLELFVRGIVALGCVPQINSEPSLDITPIDYAAEAMCHLSLSAMADKKYQTYHIANSQSLTLERLLDNLENLGHKIARVDSDQFLRVVSERGAALTAAESASCLALCRGMGDGDFEAFRTMDLFQATAVIFDQTNTLAGLEGSGLTCPAPDDLLITSYINRALKAPGS